MTPVGANPTAVVAKHNAADNPHAFTAAGLALARAATVAAQKEILGVGGFFLSDLDCSTNPNFPEAKAGQYCTVSKTGKIGGTSGKAVTAGAVLICRADSAAGTLSAVGQNWIVISGEIAKAASSLGLTWTEETTSYTWAAGICYGGGKFVAVCSNGDYKVLVTTDGETWNSFESTGTHPWVSVCHDGTQFLALSSSGKVMTSADGETWADTADIGNKDWSCVIFAGGLFVATCKNGDGGSNCVSTSPDGETWTTRTTTGALKAWTKIVEGGGVFVAVNEDDNSTLTSPDGTTWTFNSDTNTNSWYGLCYGGGTFVAAAYADPGDVTIRESTDGVNWTSSTVTGCSGQPLIEYGNGVFLLVADSSSDIFRSEDAQTWDAVTPSPALSSTYWSGMAFGGGRMVAIENYNARAYWSEE